MSENGWGKGSINNLNGWGAAAINNEIGFGDSQLRSYSGETDIDGGTGIPSIVSAPVISGATTLGSVLSTTNGTWIAKPSATYTYQWKRNGSNIIGATNSTYTLVNDDGATNITCQVTATNDFGSTSATSNTLAIPAFTDADAQAFITAASITNPTQQSAINQLVTDLKGYGVWTKMKALYPFVGGTASSHKFNLKDPRDLDAAFRLVFNGGWTHSSNGALPNGTNGYADTFLTPSIHSTLNSQSLGYYSGSNLSETSADPVNMGAFDSLSQATSLLKSNTVLSSRLNGSLIIHSTTTMRGFFSSSKQSSTLTDIYLNGLQVGTGNSGGTLPVLNRCFLGTLSLSSVPYNGGYVRNDFRFAYLSDGLNDTEMSNFYTAVQTFQVTLGRSIGTQTVSDADAQAFVTNAGIVDQVEANAVNNLVIGLKADGLWSKMKAVYPFVGGTSTSTSYNLKNTAQFQITWNGGVTHSSTGVTFNGTNGYGNTGLNPSSALTLNNTHLSFYSRTNGSLGIDLGATSTGDTSSLFIAQNYFSNFYADSYSGTSRFMLPSQTSGLLAISRSASNSFKAFKNATQIGSTITSTSGILPNWNLFLGATNLNGATNPSAYSGRNIAFATIGDGLSDSEVVNLNSRVTTFQTTLNRQV